MLKKIIISLLALSMLFSSTACDSSDVTLPTSGTTTTTTTATPEPEEPQEDPLKGKPYSDLAYQMYVLGKDFNARMGYHDRYNDVYYGIMTSYVHDNTICNEIHFIDKEYILERTNIDFEYLDLDHMPDNLNPHEYVLDRTPLEQVPNDFAHVFDPGRDDCFYQLSENVYYEYWYDCEFQKDTMDLFQIVFLSPDHSYAVILRSYGRGEESGFALFSAYRDHIIAPMLDPETAVEATNKFMKIIFPDSAKSPAK